jgi:hypothetical protein
MQRLLLSDESLITEYLDGGHIRRILERHAAGTWNLQEQIWTLGNLELWLRIFIAGQGPEEALALDGQERTCVCSG